MYKKIAKPLIDFVIAFLGAIFLLPIFVFLIVAIKLDSKGPLLFKQNRVGKNKKLFKIWKFRTMRIDTPKDVPTHMLEHPEQYITRVGKFLRKTSLDELPQIFNILTFKMSIVGPRPALWNQEDLINERDKYNANSLRPGLTGWAQINGRDELPIDVKANYDGQYMQKIGFFFDIKIFLKTIFSVLRSEGVKEGKKEESIQVIESTEELETSVKELNEDCSQNQDNEIKPNNKDLTDNLQSENNEVNVK